MGHHYSGTPSSLIPEPTGVSTSKYGSLSDPRLRKPTTTLVVSTQMRLPLVFQGPGTQEHIYSRVFYAGL